MRKGFKIVVLAFILIIPAGIYIFLQVFGYNEFDLPVLSENGIYGEQFDNFRFDRLYDVNGIQANLDILDEKIIILEFVSSNNDPDDRGYYISRISDIFRNEKSLKILRIFENKNNGYPVPERDVDQSKGNITFLYAEEDALNEMIHSVLPAIDNAESGYEFNKIFLLDSEHKLRGSYLINDFDEIDRLILEVKILLKKEQHA